MKHMKHSIDIFPISQWVYCVVLRSRVSLMLFVYYSPDAFVFLLKGKTSHLAN